MNSDTTRTSLSQLLFLTLSVGVVASMSVAAAHAGRLNRSVAVEAAANQAAIEAFFERDSVTLELAPEQFVPELEEVIVPVRLANGAVLRIEIPWRDPRALEARPSVTLYPRDMVDFVGRVSNGEDVTPLSRPVGVQLANRSRASLCGNRVLSTLGMIDSSLGSEETEIGFIFQPEASDWEARSVAASAGCPLLASSKDCKSHKYCEVRLGIPPFTVTISGKCYRGPWPIGGICRCWLLAPDNEVEVSEFAQ